MSKISKELIKLCEGEYADKPLIVPLGKIVGDDEPVYMDFTNISGLFIAGATGTGKSVLIDTIIHSIMYKNNASNIKLYLIDPKEIELNEYNGLDYVVGGKSEYDIYKINNMLFDIKKIVDDRINNLNINKVKSILEYEKVTNNNWNHVFVVIDEGYDIFNNVLMRDILKEILKVGKNVGVHLIFATNSYLKEYSDNNFIDLFKYRMTFDLASIEQSKYIDIKNSSWLSHDGEAFIKGIDSVIYKFQALYVSDDEIKEIVLHSKNK